MAICAKEMNKSFYVVAESFKFARLYPLNQQDVPNQFKVCCCLCSKTIANNLRTTDIDSDILAPGQGTRIETLVQVLITGFCEYRLIVAVKETYFFNVVGCQC